MKTTKESRAYGKLRDIIEQHGGTMEYSRAGYRFGAWIISLNGKRAVFESTGGRILPELDRLYVPKVPNPETWDDYYDELVPGAEGQLISSLK